VTTEQIKSGIERYTPTNNRSQILTKKRLNIVLDAYNANPSSMEAALSSFSKHECDSKTVILGDMFELGKNSEQEHQYIADFAAALNFTAVHLIGKAFSTVTAKNAFKYESFQEFSKQFQSKKPKSGALLIKGSRGMELERVLDLL
jgi:UDP-N-acetylmuramoyl-tripeptide--D-alanyl-D-alanine ligase